MKAPRTPLHRVKLLQTEADMAIGLDRYNYDAKLEAQADKAYEMGWDDCLRAHGLEEIYTGKVDSSGNTRSTPA